MEQNNNSSPKNAVKSALFALKNMFENHKVTSPLR